MAISKKDRLSTYQKYDGHCAYCGKALSTIKDMQVDHIWSKRNGGGDFLENYNPSCRRCNHYKRVMGVEEFREYIKSLHNRIAKDYITKVGIDYGIVMLKPFDGVFYFEKEKDNVTRSVL